MTERDLSLQRDDGNFTLRVGALIVRGGDLLLARSGDHPYYAIGGAVKMHESSEAAVVREIREEMGLELGTGRLLAICERFLMARERKHHEVCFFYLFYVDADVGDLEEFVTDDPGESLHWIPIDRLGEVRVVPEAIRGFDFEGRSGIAHVVSQEDACDV